MDTQQQIEAAQQLLEDITLQEDFVPAHHPAEHDNTVPSLSSPLPRRAGSNGRIQVAGHMSPLCAVRKDKRMQPARGAKGSDEKPHSNYASMMDQEDIRSWVTADLSDEEDKEYDQKELDAILSKLQDVDVWRTQSTESIEDEEKRAEEINTLIHVI